MQLFLSAPEKENLRNWKYAVEDDSLTTKMFTPFWNWLVKLVPNTVSPNILTLVGFLFILYSFHLSYKYGDEYNSWISIVVSLCTFIYMTLDAIDGKHARRIGNSSPLGELFDHMCDNIGVVFMISTACMLLGLENMTWQWYIIQSAQTVFLCSHIDAFKNKVVRFGKFNGPGEALMLYMFVLIVNGFGGFGHWAHEYISVCSENPLTFLDYLMPLVYLGVIIFTIIIFR